MRRFPSNSTITLLAAFIAASFLSTASAQTLPISYQLQLQVRADTGGTAFNLPNGSTFNSVSATINDAGNVAVKVNTVGATTSPGLWFGGHGIGALVYNANDSAAILSDAFLNNNNQASFPRLLMSRRMKVAAIASIGSMNSETLAPSGISPPSMPIRTAQVAKM